MARLGNEARLLLKLARERAEHRKADRMAQLTQPEDWWRGYVQCSDDIWGVFDQAVLEVEERG